MTRLTTRLGYAATVGLLAGCVQQPIAPTDNVTPGPGKSFAAFQADQQACEAAAAKEVAGQSQSANSVALMGALGAAAVSGATGNGVGGVAGAANASGTGGSAQAQASIQQNYDRTYDTCMYAAGDNVPNMAPLPPPPPEPAVVRHVVPPNPLVLAVQRQLVRLGYLRGGADGVAGPMTASAIRQAETDKGLTVDGVASRKLLTALQASQPAAAQAAAPPAAAPNGKFALPPASTPAP